MLSRTSQLALLLTAALTTPALSAQSAKEAKERAIFQELVTEGNRLRTGLEGELRNIQADQVFAILNGPQTPTKAALEDAILKVNKADKAFAVFLPKYEQLAKSVCGKLTAVDARDGRDCRAGLVDAPVTRQFESQRLYFVDLRSLLDFLISKSGAYSKESARFSFKNKADGQAFNTLVEKLLARQNENRALQQQGEQALQRMQSRMGTQR